MNPIHHSNQNRSERNTAIPKVLLDLYIFTKIHMKYHAYMHKQINGVEQSTNAKVDSGTRIPIQTDSHARALSTTISNGNSGNQFIHRK